MLNAIAMRRQRIEGIFDIIFLCILFLAKKETLLFFLEFMAQIHIILRQIPYHHTLPLVTISGEWQIGIDNINTIAQCK